jgi:ABC-type multidrug transport system fused ATPase/permease subunit
VLTVIFIAWVQSTLFAILTLRASRKLHDGALASVARAPLSWHDSQPSGRVLSRFAGDVDAVDTALPGSLEPAIDNSTQCALTLVLICAVVPPFLAAALPLAAAFAIVTTLFRRVSRELKRLDSLARGPLTSAVTAAAGGASTLAAFRGAAAAAAAAARAHIDATTATYFSLYSANRWVAIRIDFVTSATVAATAAAVIGAGVEPSLAGLATSYALSLAGVLQYTMRLVTETESLFTSVERLAA